MKLYNHTKINDKILEKVLYLSAKAVGAVRTGKVVVKVTTSTYGCSGEVRNSRYGFMYYHGYLNSSRKWNKKTGEYINKKDRKLISTDGGYMFLKITAKHREPLILAERIFDLASHEWQHIKDLQKHGKFGSYNRNWKNRPHERRAITASKRAERVKDKRLDIQDAILNLAIYIEELQK